MKEKIENPENKTSAGSFKKSADTSEEAFFLPPTGFGGINKNKRKNTKN